MKKSNFVAMILGTIGGIFAALGMCMCLVPEWNAFNPGVVMGCIGIVVLLITMFVWRKMEHKEPIRLTGKTILTVVQKRLCKPPKSGKIKPTLEVLLWQGKAGKITVSCVK